MRFSTRAIHAGQDPDPLTGSVTVPVYLTSTYQQPGPGKEGKYVYSRTANPTRTALEECLASLETGRHGLAFSSGMAATTTILLSLKKGDHVVAGDDIYGGTYRLFEQVLRNYGLQFTYVNPENPENVEKAIRKNSRLVWIESPTNPLMRIVDIRQISRISKKAHSLLVVDNTFMSPYLQNPLQLGADIVVHSTTKYLGGPSDLIGGATIPKNAEVANSLKTLRVFTVAESLGGVESLIEHPASMTHASVPKERRLKLGISDNLIRVSVGIEDVEDLVQDLDKSFKAV